MRYKDIVKSYIIENDIDFIFEMAATDTATIDTMAENITDEIALLYPVDSDGDRDALVKAVYDVLKNDHADELKKGALIQDIIRAKIDTGVNVWDLFDELTNMTIDELETVKRGCKI